MTPSYVKNILLFSFWVLTRVFQSLDNRVQMYLSWSPPWMFSLFPASLRACVRVCTHMHAYLCGLELWAIILTPHCNFLNKIKVQVRGSSAVEYLHSTWRPPEFSPQNWKQRENKESSWIDAVSSPFGLHYLPSCAIYTFLSDLKIVSLCFFVYSHSHC